MMHIQLSKKLAAFTLSVNIHAPQQGVIALFGRSGCGKSSTINLVAGLMQPDAGVVQVQDRVLFDSAQRINLPCEQRGIGYVFQDARLFPHYSVHGNLVYGLSRVARNSPQQIKLQHITELLGLHDLLSRRPQQLSGGEKQRVALGRALLSQPRLLLLDEPLASLDMARRSEVLPYLERIRDELRIPMLYVSHQFDEVLQLATHVALMQQGRITAQGDLASLSHHPALRAIIGAEAMGTVIDSHVTHIDHHDALAQVPVGSGMLRVESSGLRMGQPVRLQLLARDLILATHNPTGLSVRNHLQGNITAMHDDTPNTVLVTVDVGKVLLQARVTRAACLDLKLEKGMLLWVLIKTVTLRGHVYTGRSAVNS